MPKYYTTERTPLNWRGQPTPKPGTPVEMTADEARYEVSLGILTKQPAEKPKAKSKPSGHSDRDKSE